MGLTITRKSKEVEIELSGAKFFFKRPDERHRLEHLLSIPPVLMDLSRLEKPKEKEEFFKKHLDVINSWNINHVGVKIARAFECLIRAEGLIDEEGAPLDLEKQELWENLDFDIKAGLGNKFHEYVTGEAESKDSKKLSK